MIRQIWKLIQADASPRDIIIYVAAMFLTLTFSLSVHELMHGYSAFKLGDDTAKLKGRLTLNPLAHLDPVGTLMMLFVGFGWAKPVPVNYSRLNRFKNRSVSIRIVSLAGVAANFTIAFIAYFFLMLCSYGQMKLLNGQSPGVNLTGVMGFASFSLQFFIILFYFLHIYNLLLMAFNLLPLPPLDGYRFVDTFLPYRIRYKLSGLERYTSMILMGLILMSYVTGFSPLIALVNLIEIPFVWLIETPINLLFKMLFNFKFHF